MITVPASRAPLASALSNDLVERIAQSMEVMPCDRDWPPGDIGFVTASRHPTGWFISARCRHDLRDDEREMFQVFVAERTPEDTRGPRRSIRPARAAPRLISRGAQHACSLSTPESCARSNAQATIVPAIIGTSSHHVLSATRAATPNPTPTLALASVNQANAPVPNARGQNIPRARPSMQEPYVTG